MLTNTCVASRSRFFFCFGKCVGITYTTAIMEKGDNVRNQKNIMQQIENGLDVLLIMALNEAFVSTSVSNLTIVFIRKETKN